MLVKFNKSFWSRFVLKKETFFSYSVSLAPEIFSAAEHISTDGAVSHIAVFIFEPVILFQAL